MMAQYVDYYTYTSLLSQKDIEGETPEVYLVCTNRTGGKTTSALRLLVKNWLNKRRKFMVIYRYKNELADLGNTLFNDVKNLFFEKHTFDSTSPSNKKRYSELIIDDDVAGYAVALNDAYKLKKFSHVFNSVMDMYMDEFQSEDGRYLPDEVERLFSLHTSVARGNGKQSRYVRLIMSSNAISVLNPYYDALGVYKSKPGKEFTRGVGWVLQTTLVESASQAQSQSRFNKAFSGCIANKMNTTIEYINDSDKMICKCPATARYRCTLYCDGTPFGVKEDGGLIYVTESCDPTYPLCISKETIAVDVGRGRNEITRKMYRTKLDSCLFRFETQKCKSATLHCLSY